MGEAELIELIIAFLPETVPGWAAFGVLACALVSVAAPAPTEESHPAWKIGHRIISIIGLGAGKIRAVGKVANILRRKQ